MAVLPSCFEETGNGEIQTQLARAGLLVDHHKRSRGAIACHLRQRRNSAQRYLRRFSRDRDYIGRMFNCGSKGNEYSPVGRFWLLRFTSATGPVTTDHHAFRQEQQGQPSYSAHLQSLAVRTAMKKRKRRMEPPGECEPICDCHLSAKRKSACDHWTGVKTISD